MANAEYVAQLNALKARLLTQKNDRITKTTNSINSQYEKQIAFINKIIERYS